MKSPMKSVGVRATSFFLLLALPTLALAQSAGPEAAFSRLDRDGNGELSPVELAAMPKVAFYDRNGDGRITREDLAPASAGLPHSAAPATTPTGTEASAQGLQFLFVGHSLVQPAIRPLARIAAAAGIEGHGGKADIRGGTSARVHWNVKGPEQRVQPDVASGKYDVLVLGAYYGDKPEDWAAYVALGRAHRPNLRVLVQDAWPDIGRDEAQVPDAATFALRMAGLNATVATNVIAVNGQYPGTVRVIPVGNAMLLLRTWMEDGRVPGLSKVRGDLYRDNIHPTPVVGVLEGYVYFACVYGRSPVGLPNPFREEGIGDELNTVLQRVAWSAATQHPLSGVEDAESPSREGAIR